MKESFFWHKVHSLTGVIPTGFYLVQHLTLNSFSLAGEKYNGVLHFFEGMPKHILLGLKAVIWGCLIFHAVYGIFITTRGKENYTNSVLKYRENRYYWLQRASGIFLFFFLSYHLATTSITGQIKGIEVLEYSTWAPRLAGGFYLVGLFYVLGVMASAYHFSYGLWNFCIRWGITINEAAQNRMARFSAGAFVAISMIGIAALIGFFKPIFQSKHYGEISVEAPAPSVAASYSSD